MIDIAEIGTDPERLRSFTPELVHADEHHRHGEAVALLAFPEDERLCRHAARRHLAARARISTTGRCRRCARCCSSTSGPRGSIARTTSTTGARSASSSTGPEAEKQGVAFDTSLRGNGNGGHTYGRELSVQDREALLEYLKTL